MFSSDDSSLHVPSQGGNGAALVIEGGEDF